MSFVKRALRGATRFYLTHTPIIKGRYPIMMLVHKFASEPVTVEVMTKDRGKMLLDLEDSAQFPLYYNIYEWKDQPTILALASGASLILDIGSNIGQMALLFATVAKRIVCFEPVPTLAKRLREQIALNQLESRINVKEIALSSSEGVLPLHLPDEHNGGNGSLISSHRNTGKTITVRTARLDDILIEDHLSKIDLVKIDIEGAELFALQGMPKLLSSDSPPILILEMNSSMMADAGYSAKDLLDLLKPYGYGCYEFARNGLHGPLADVTPVIENYCFLTSEHLKRTVIRDLIHESR